MYALNIARAIKKMTSNEIIDFIFENYYKQIGFSKENSYYSMKHWNMKYLFLLPKKLIEKIQDRPNVKNTINHLSKNPTKAVKQSEIITCQPQTFEHSNTVDKNS